jgi:NTP pyrophosphatase (non-canonical NTP hydrolase)
MMISEQLRKELLAFRSEREWAQFHNLRIVLEAAELAEITQWARDADIGRIEHDQLGRIEHEVADIAILLTYLAHDCGIDIETAVRRKLRINAEKYPVERSRGTSKKYTEF